MESFARVGLSLAPLSSRTTKDGPGGQMSFYGPRQLVDGMRTMRKNTIFGLSCYPPVISTSFITVRQLRTVLVVASFESK
jgi:hypothetical protein